MPSAAPGLAARGAVHQGGRGFPAGHSGASSVMSSISLNEPVATGPAALSDGLALAPAAPEGASQPGRMGHRLAPQRTPSQVAFRQAPEEPVAAHGAVAASGAGGGGAGGSAASSARASAVRERPPPQPPPSQLLQQTSGPLYRLDRAPPDVVATASSQPAVRRRAASASSFGSAANGPPQQWIAGTPQRAGTPQPRRQIPNVRRSLEHLLNDPSDRFDSDSLYKRGRGRR